MAAAHKPLLFQPSAAPARATKKSPVSDRAINPTADVPSIAPHIDGHRAAKLMKYCQFSRPGCVTARCRSLEVPAARPCAYEASNAPQIVRFGNQGARVREFGHDLYFVGRGASKSSKVSPDTPLCGRIRSPAWVISLNRTQLGADIWLTGCAHAPRATRRPKKG